MVYNDSINYNFFLGKDEWIEKEKGAYARCYNMSNGGICIQGNSKGLEHIGKKILYMSQIKESNGYHIHMDPYNGDLEEGSEEITIINDDFDS